MKLRKSLMVLAFGLPLAAQAQPIQGLYLGGGIGGNYLQGTDIKGSDFSGANTSVDFHWGWAGVLSLGWGFGNGLRAEIEGSYRQNEVSDISFPGASGFTEKGNVRSWGAMANMLYDIDLGNRPWGITPYVGAGLGYVWHEYDKVGIRVGGNTIDFNGDGGAFAYQAILGAAFPIQQVPGLSITAEYRFLGAANQSVKGTGRATLPDQSDAGTLKFDVDNFNHSLLIGLRYAFNTAPAPAPVMAAAPAIMRSYLVFFDWNRADLTERARQIIAEAAQSRASQQVTRIEVNGYADRSGPAQFNEVLSLRRAEAVATELLRRGVPRNEIVTRGFGEANPLVPTADGVREPQNRRVEIILR
ncbi:MAG: OmpA family protein [Roseomonas sp.]